MGTFLLIVLGILVVVWLIFDPTIDHVELYAGENWAIMWYNRYFFHNGKLNHQRDWKPLFSFERYD